MTVRKVSVREALREGMSEMMRIDDKVFLLGEEVAQYNGAYKVSQGMLEEFGEKRVIDSPITEYGFAGLGCGAAFGGLKPIIEFMTFNFALQAIDHILNSAAKTAYMSGGRVRCPIIFRGPNGSAKRVAAQHSQCFASWYAHCPGLIVISPYHAQDAKFLMKKAIENENPVVFLEHELLYGEMFEIDDSQEESVQIGKAKIAQEGSDITIVSFSYGMHFAKKAVEILKNEHNISVELIDLLTLRPLDIDTVINSVKKTNKILCVEEGWGYAGIGSEIIAQVNEKAFDYLDHEPVRIAAEDCPLPYAPNLEEAAIPSVEKIVQACLKILNK
jgi:pyruvate dehydrogenase E1 component beta subunit